MTETEQNEAIAVFCGWKKLVPDGSRPWGARAPGDKCYYSVHELPDYLNDLNAVHDAECLLTESMRIIYVNHLCETQTLGSKFFQVHFTAKQRCEALLRAIGKWKA